MSFHTVCLVYASGLDDQQRQARALALIAAIPPENLILPVQVLGECYGVLTRGLANVRAEFSLTALAYNLRRAINILGVEAMIAGVAA